ncbi:HN1_G0025070.mRNA.1.CDS.1 [Saccharomyces cerevisiae]|nr:HN1_G0025070.mRNA.1.CDS.1 [Saccharomyces cerevisiae]CAI4820760.1 BAL_1a_G0055800.mRNA.1.CDS.1 [Saccharomyces cerevisiae]CAI7389217.1 BAL_1a_G0055800.mRNA.1.CDS.1 [Saccharomyces cerevisiae]
MRSETGVSIKNPRPSRPFSCFWRKGDVENIRKSDIGNEKKIDAKFNSLQYNLYYKLLSHHKAGLLYKELFFRSCFSYTTCSLDFQGKRHQVERKAPSRKKGSRYSTLNSFDIARLLASTPYYLLCFNSL